MLVPCAPSAGSVTAAMATPSGCALCRMPMARPRSCRANQPRMSLPLAANTDPPQRRPGRGRAPSAAGPCTERGEQEHQAGQRTGPLDSTTRSPHRSAAAPQPISVSSSPTVGQATRMLASSSENPSCRRAGIRYARPYWNVQPAVMAISPTNRMSQRRRGADRRRSRTAASRLRPPLRCPYADTTYPYNETRWTMRGRRRRQRRPPPERRREPGGGRSGRGSTPRDRRAGAARTAPPRRHR